MTPAFARYVAPARSHPQIWRLLAGLATILLVYGAVVAAVLGGLWVFSPPEARGARLEQLALGTTPGGMMLLLLSFGGLILGTMLAARLWHKRAPATLIGRPAARVLRDFTIAGGILLAFNAIMLTLFGGGAELVAQTDPKLWLVLLPLALAGLMIQTGAEEIVFRGYLQQQLAARFASPLIWMVLPSVLFGFLHYQPGLMGPNAGYVVAATGLFGLVAADLTARTGTLGAAWGLHFANNTIALLIFSSNEAMYGLALYTLPIGIEDPQAMRLLILFDMAILVVIWAACRIGLRR